MTTGRINQIASSRAGWHRHPKPTTNPSFQRGASSAARPLPVRQHRLLLLTSSSCVRRSSPLLRRAPTVRDPFNHLRGAHRIPDRPLLSAADQRGFSSHLLARSTRTLRGYLSQAGVGLVTLRAHQRIQAQDTVRDTGPPFKGRTWQCNITSTLQ